MREELPSMNRLISDKTVIIAVFVFVANAVFYIALFDPKIQGYVDAERGWRQFNHFLANGSNYWGPENQIELRVYMVLFTLLELLALSILGLIEKRVLITYLALPASAYLATKLKVEFAFFPLALISLNVPLKREVPIFLGIVLFSIWIGENNGYIILFYRLLARMLRWYRPPLYLVLLMLAAPLIADANMSTLVQFIPKLNAYSYTRDIVNPEYTVFETFAVFLASMTVGANAYIDYFVGFLGSFFVLWLAFGKQVLKRSAWRAWIRSPGFQAWLITILTFTALTHAFQAARYYFFYLPVFTAIGGERVNKILLATSIPMTYALAAFYKFVLNF